MRREALFVVLCAVCACAPLYGIEDRTRAVDDVNAEGGAGGDARPTSDGNAPDGIIGPDGVPCPPYTPCTGNPDCKRVVFVTSNKVSSLFHSVAAADDICNAAAASPKASCRVRGRHFLAWLSTVTQPVGAHLLHATAPYERVDGQPIADGWKELTDTWTTPLLNPISFDESGAELADLDRQLAWTGTRDDASTYSYAGDAGTVDETCDDWNSNSSSLRVAVGAPNYTSFPWTWQLLGATCDTSAHLYCFEE